MGRVIPIKASSPKTPIVLADCDFEINPGLNDTWHEPGIDGQGCFVSVFPETGTRQPKGLNPL